MCCTGPRVVELGISILVSRIVCISIKMIRKKNSFCLLEKSSVSVFVGALSNLRFYLI
jgi:hypothetical protein